MAKKNKLSFKYQMEEGGKKVENIAKTTIHSVEVWRGAWNAHVSGCTHTKRFRVRLTVYFNRDGVFVVRTVSNRPLGSAGTIKNKIK